MMDQLTMLELATRITEYLGGKVEGYDTDGATYTSLMDMWKQEGLASEATAPEPPAVGSSSSGGRELRSSSAAKQQQQQQEQPEKQQEQPAWYTQAYDYWEAEKNCPATVDGVLGGFGNVTGKDVESSLRFLARLRRTYPSLQKGRALDCGAGIGRVTRDLLLPSFDAVDLLEQSPRLIAAAPAYIGEQASRVTFLCQGMQDFSAEAGTYDVVWIQWCIGHLHDVDLVKFLQRMKPALKPGGLVCVKDNCCDEVDFVVDKDDSSLTRSASYLKALFRVSGMKLVSEEAQEGFPDELFPVVMFAFAPQH